jgi:hypothetical protein
MAAPIQVIHPTLQGVLNIGLAQSAISATCKAEPKNLRERRRKLNHAFHSF